MLMIFLYALFKRIQSAKNLKVKNVKQTKLTENASSQRKTEAIRDSPHPTKQPEFSFFMTNAEPKM